MLATLAAAAVGVLLAAHDTQPRNPVHDTQPRNPARLKGVFLWCDCGTGARSTEVFPSGRPNETRTVSVGAPLPNWIDWGRPVKTVSWRCDGMGRGRGEATKEATLPRASRWWTVSLPAPLAGGLPTHPIGCAPAAHGATGKPHFATWAEGSAKEGPASSSVVFATGEGRPSVPKDYACVKIPTLLATQKRTLLAFAEARIASCSDGAQTDLIVKRSSDQVRLRPLTVLPPLFLPAPLLSASPLPSYSS